MNGDLARGAYGRLSRSFSFFEEQTREIFLQVFQ
jgi:hypothetical protein